jgi:hypothetical protein
MKKILLIALFLMPVIGFSQTLKPIDGFLSIKFGSSKADVTAAIKAKGGTVSKEAPNALVFKGIKLGHLDVFGLTVWFYNDQACQAQFFFKAELEDKTIDFYNDLMSQVSDVYGQGKSTRVFRSTFKDGDGYEITAIEQGDADYSTIWADKDNKHRIVETISPKLYIMLTYMDTVLTDASFAQDKAKEKGDF